MLFLSVQLNPRYLFLCLSSFALSLRSRNFGVLEVGLQLVVPLLQLLNLFYFLSFIGTLLLL